MMIKEQKEDERFRYEKKKDTVQLEKIIDIRDPTEVNLRPTELEIDDGRESESENRLEGSHFNAR